MRQDIDKIEIKEPPIEELTKKKSCLRRTCFTGCGCFTLLFIISLILLRFTVGPRTKELRDLPPHFVENVPIYDAGGIEKITHVSGKERGKTVEFAAYIPKLILSPFIVFVDKEHKYIPLSVITSTSTEKLSNWQVFTTFVRRPIVDHRDEYKIEWTNHSAKQNFVIEYYETELLKKGYEIGVVSTNERITQFTFRRDEKNIDGLVYTLDDPTTPLTDFISLTINTPSNWE